MKKLLLPLCLLLCISSLFSCSSNCKENYTFYGNYALHFYVLDKETEQNLLEIGVNRYYRDTVEIYNKYLEPLGIHPDLDGSIVFGFFDSYP